jgi:hypothetical protein
LILVAVLAALGGVVVIGLSRDVDDWYWRNMVGPQLREDLGFDTGYACSEGELRLFCITRVVPGGGFDRAGIQAGDVFFAYHGYSSGEFYSTLEGGRGSNVTLNLKRPPDWRPVRVTVEVPK